MSFGRHLPRHRPPRACSPRLASTGSPLAKDRENAKARVAAIEDAHKATLLARSAAGNVGQIPEHLEMAITAIEDAKALAEERN